MPIEVLIVEDNAVFREALEVLLGLDGDLEVVGSVADGRGALAACEEHPPDVIWSTTGCPTSTGSRRHGAPRRLPGRSRRALTAASRGAGGRCPREAGAVACITKDRDLGEIVAAIRAAAGTGGTAR